MTDLRVAGVEKQVAEEKVVVIPVHQIAITHSLSHPIPTFYEWGEAEVGVANGPFRSHFFTLLRGGV